MYEVITWICILIAEFLLGLNFDPINKITTPTKIWVALLMGTALDLGIIGSVTLHTAWLAFAPTLIILSFGFGIYPFTMLAVLLVIKIVYHY